MEGALKPARGSKDDAGAHYCFHTGLWRITWSAGVGQTDDVATSNATQLTENKLPEASQNT